LPCLAQRDLIKQPDSPSEADSTRRKQFDGHSRLWFRWGGLV